MLWSLFGAGALAGALLSTLIGNAVWNTKLAQCELTHEKAMRELSRSTAEQIARANAATNAVSLQLEEKQRELYDREKALLARIRALKRIPVSDAHRMLINAASEPTRPLPETSGQPTSSPTGPTPDTPAARGTDNLAEWAVTAGTMYRACQDQIGAIRGWAEKAFSPETRENQEADQ